MSAPAKSIRQRVYSELSYDMGQSTAEIAWATGLTRRQVYRSLCSMQQAQLVESWTGQRKLTLWRRVGATDANRPRLPWDASGN
jgi:DNA-binding IclR family transcriptional regulator